MKTLSKILFAVLLFCVGLKAQDNYNWRIADGIYGIVDFNKTITYTSNGVRVFENNGTPKEPGKILGLGWTAKVLTQKVPLEFSGNFRLKSGTNLDSIEVFLTIISPNGSWSFLAGQAKILNSNDWKYFTWDLSDPSIDSLAEICLSYQLRTKSLSTTEGVVELKDLKFSIVTGIDEHSKIPSEFNLSQNYPNPFNPTTKIKFSVPQREQVNLTIFNSLGQEVRTLVSEEKEIGSYEVDFNASNLPSGIYFYKLQAGNLIETKKMILLK